MWCCVCSTEKLDGRLSEWYENKLLQVAGCLNMSPCMTHSQSHPKHLHGRLLNLLKHKKTKFSSFNYLEFFFSFFFHLPQGCIKERFPRICFNWFKYISTYVLSFNTCYHLETDLLKIESPAMLDIAETKKNMEVNTINKCTVVCCIGRVENTNRNMKIRQ